MSSLLTASGIDFRGRVGARIRAARRRRGLTQTKLARLIGSSTPRSASGKMVRAMPEMVSLEALAAALRVSVETFFRD